MPRILVVINTTPSLTPQSASSLDLVLGNNKQLTRHNLLDKFNNNSNNNSLSHKAIFRVNGLLKTKRCGKMALVSLILTISSQEIKQSLNSRINNPKRTLGLVLA